MDTFPRPVSSVSNTELYSRWAKYYDGDGNMLQAIDEHEIPKLLIRFFDLMVGEDEETGFKFKISELGCGTGRNTSKLLQPPLVDSVGEVHGLDFSDEMLRVARERCGAIVASNSLGLRVNPVFHFFDALQDQSPPVEAQNADGVVSTLVLEHLPIATFFQAVKKVLKKSGYLLLTNMHEDMGKRGQAGFVDVKTGEKIRGRSFVYSIEEVIEEAEKQGFRLDGNFKERGIDQADLDIVGGRGRKWLGCKVWFACIFKYEMDS